MRRGTLWGLRAGGSLPVPPKRWKARQERHAAEASTPDSDDDDFPDGVSVRPPEDRAEHPAQTLRADQRTPSQKD